MMAGLSSLKQAARTVAAPETVPQRPRQGTAPSAQKQTQDRVAGKPGTFSAPNSDQVQALAEQINQTLQQMEGQFSVSVDDATGMVVVRITDDTTGEIVKQIPPQQILDADVSVEKIIGLLVNDEA